jgi:hypothetical protein
VRTSFVLNPLKTKHSLLYLKTQFVPRSKHFFISVIKTNQFVYDMAKDAVGSEIIQNTEIRCRENVQLYIKLVSDSVFIGL